jgi:putative membrane protein
MIRLAANIGILVVALLHLWFCILEMFFWKKPLGLKVFRITQAFANESAALAANQGLYNAFLSAGFLWGLLSGDPAQSFHVKVFFLSAVIVAGIYAGFTVNKRIFYIQALPAIVTFILLLIS